MRFICDVHIAYKLAVYLQTKGCECFHVNHVFQRSETEDIEIAQYANGNDLIVITKDSDFRDSYFLKRSPRKLIKLNTGNSSTEQMIRLFEENWPLLIEANTRSHFFIESDLSQFYLIEFED